MALHTPTHHAGFAGSTLLRDVLIAFGLAAALLVVMGIAMTVKVNIGPASTMTEERQSMIQFRAGERADWAAGVQTEGSSLIEFRASERSGQ
jgi:hypothetical protein